MNVKVRLKIDLKPLERYINILSKAGQEGWNQIMIKWVVRYKKFAQAQFRKNSSGGGIWPPLKEPIRKRVKKRSHKILIDSETLVSMLDPIPTLDKNPRPGLLTTRFKNSVRIGFGGSGKHPYFNGSVARLATIHHAGIGNVPSRPILIDPTDELTRQMANDVRTVANQIKRNL